MKKKKTTKQHMNYFIRMKNRAQHSEFQHIFHIIQFVINHAINVIQCIKQLANVRTEWIKNRDKSLNLWKW